MGFTLVVILFEPSFTGVFSLQPEGKRERTSNRWADISQCQILRHFNDMGLD